MPDWGWTGPRSPRTTPRRTCVPRLRQERLVVATWALAIVGFLTLCAAIAAACLAYMAYALEAVPGIIVSLPAVHDPIPNEPFDVFNWPRLLPEDGYRKPLYYKIVEDSESGEPTLLPLVPSDEAGAVDRLHASALRVLFVENVGRSVVVGARIRYRIDAIGLEKSTNGSDVLLARKVKRGSGEVMIPSIQSRERVPIKIIKLINNATGLAATGVTGARLDKKPTGGKRRKVTPFASEPVVFGVTKYAR